MKKTLEFVVQIAAPRSVVWDAMLGPETYKDWTSVFAEGSYYRGSWATGKKIQFLGPSGDGMSSEIAENRLHEFVSIRHLGEISGGVEDTTSEKVRAWAPAYENYTFSDVPGGTQVRVTLDVVPEYEAYMKETYPKSLERLKAIAETGVRAKSEA
jgi:hypothetical protein